MALQPNGRSNIKCLSNPRRHYNVGYSQLGKTGGAYMLPGYAKDSRWAATSSTAVTCWEVGGAEDVLGSDMDSAARFILFFLGFDPSAVAADALMPVGVLFKKTKDNVKGTRSWINILTYGRVYCFAFCLTNNLRCLLLNVLVSIRLSQSGTYIESTFNKRPYERVVV